MESMWKRLLTVLALSLLLPQLMVHFGSKYYAAPEPNSTTGQTAPTLGTTVPFTTAPREEPVSCVIPVLVSENRVVQMELETYVRGVVLAEMPASFGEEALKAQAIAARTYALRRVTLGDRHPEGAVCAQSTCCQAWLSDEDYLDKLGTPADVEKITAAVADTAGLVVTYNEKLAETTYFSCSGGRTESALAVWNSEIPYLVAVDSPGEEWAAAFSHQLDFTLEEFAACLGRSLTGSPEEWIGKQTRTDGGGVATLVIGGISYSGVELRRLLGLPSTAFTVMATGEGITVTALGHGHRVGLSQYGAGAMADLGSDYKQILQHYYPGTEIDKIGQIG